MEDLILVNTGNQISLVARKTLMEHLSDSVSANPTTQINVTSLAQDKKAPLTESTSAPNQGHTAYGQISAQPSSSRTPCGNRTRIPGFDESRCAKPNPLTEPRKHNTGTVILQGAETTPVILTSLEPSNSAHKVEPAQTETQILDDTFSHKSVETLPKELQSQMQPKFELSSKTVEPEEQVPHAERQKFTSRSPLACGLSRKLPMVNQHNSTQNAGNLESKSRCSKISASLAQLRQSGYETPQHVLSHLRETAPQQIGYSSRDQGRQSTTCLRDLEIARGPLPVDDLSIVQTKRNSIPQASVLTQNQMAEASDTHAESGEVDHGRKPSRQNGEQPQSLVLADSRFTTGSLPDNEDPQNLDPKSTFAMPVDNSASKTATHDVQSRTSRNPRWCAPIELRATPAKTGSDAWGSEIPADNMTDSRNSLGPLYVSHLFRTKEIDRPEHNIAGWDGKMQHPPLDWNDRPRFSKNTPEFKNAFDNWAGTTAELVASKDNSVILKTTPPEKIQNVEFHPDGVDMVPRNFVIDFNTAPTYGYNSEVAEVTQFSWPIDPEDFEEWGKLDRRIPENVRVANETTDDLVATSNAHNTRGKAKRDVGRTIQLSSRQPMEIYKPVPNPNRPKVNIYLRPATKTDIPQLTALYNWHIEHTSHTAECEIIVTADMRHRFETAKSNKLPFVVALLRSNIKRADEVIGFAVAQDFTAPDYVERISAELEVYVHHKWMNQGVGRCLLDQLLTGTDRGHLQKGGYPFHCDNQISHLYTAGGGRDLHMLVFVVRHWKTPTPMGITSDGKPVWLKSKNGDAVVIEQDYSQWIKKWLEGWNFEEQRCLKGIGAKQGRL